MADVRNVPLTRGDLEEFKAEVASRLDSLEHRVENLLQQAEEKILTAVFRLAETMQQRLIQAEATQAAFNVRLATLEERITELEKRLSMPSRRVQ
jgi:tetrahydromethanopterin S-methyltransferase subunit G